MTKAYEDVEFKTIDGITLRGWWFSAAKKGPAVIMTPGVGFSTCMQLKSVFQY